MRTVARTVAEGSKPTASDALRWVMIRADIEEPRPALPRLHTPRSTRRLIPGYLASTASGFVAAWILGGWFAVRSLIRRGR